MKTYLLAVVLLLLTIPSLAFAEERTLVKAGPPGGKHGPVWKYVTKAEPKEGCNYEAINLKKKVRPNIFRHKGIPG